MKFFRLVLALAATGIMLVTAQAQAQAPAKSRLQIILERGSVRIGTTGDFNPMSIRDPATNAYRGFDVEAMEQFAKDLGVKIEWVPTEWATLVAGITANRYDIFAGGSSLNMARAKTVAFSDPYTEAGTVPLVLKTEVGKYKSWADLNQSATVVSVLLGTVFEEQAKSHLAQARLRTVEKPATGYQEVLAGRAQVTLTSNIEAASLVKNFPSLAIVTGAELRNKRPFAYPLPQGDPVWTTYVNNWIALKKSEGFFQSLEAKWLSGQ